MKKMHKLASAVALTLGAGQAYGQVLYEPFDYSNGASSAPLTASSGVGANYSTQGTYWATRGTQSATMLRPNTEVIPTPAYMTGATAILPPSFGTSVRSVTTGNNETATLGLGQYTSTNSDLYWSAIVKPNTNPSTTAGVMMAGIVNFSLPTTSEPGLRQATLWTKQTSATTYQLGLGGNGTLSAAVQWSSNINFSAGASQFVVVKLSNLAGSANDTMSMWVNPNSNFGSATEAPGANAQSFLTYSPANDLTDSLPTTATGLPSNAAFYIRTGNTGTGNMHFDEVRVDTTWAGVTPDGNKQFTWSGSNTGGNLSDATWAKLGTNPDASPNSVGAVANFGTLGTAGTPLNAGAVITTAGQTVDSINIRNGGNGINIGGAGLTISSNASAGQIVAYNGNQTISAPLTLASNVAVKANTGASVLLTGAVTGTGKTLQKFGQGTVTLGAANLLAADVNLDVRAASLNLGGFAQQAGTVTVGVSHTNQGSGLGGPDLSPATIDGAVGSSIAATSFDLRSGSINVPITAGDVVKNNAGLFTLTGANSYSGTTTVNSGRLVLAGTPTSTVNATINANAPGFSPSGLSQLEISSDANLGPAPGSPTTLLTINGGTFVMTSTMTLNANRTINANAASSGLSASPSTVVATIPGLITGTGGINQTGSGTLVLSNTNNNYAGKTNIAAGRLHATNPGAVPNFGVSGNVNLTTSSSNFSVAVGGGGQWTSTDVDTVLGAAAFVAGSKFGFDTAGGDFTYNTNISGLEGIQKYSLNRLTLGGNNSFSGNVIINDGALRITSNNALGDTAGTTLVEGGASANTPVAVLELIGGVSTPESIVITGKSSGNNASPSINNISGDNAITGNITFATSGTWYNVQSDSGKLTLTQVNNTINNATGRQLNLRGAGDGEILNGVNSTGLGPVSINKYDGGTWSVKGASNYTGGTVINGGTLRFENAGTVGVAGSNVTNNGTLQVYSNNTIGNVTGTGTSTIGDGVNAATVEAKRFLQGTLGVGSGSTLKITAAPDLFTSAGVSPSVSNVTSLSVGGTGKLNLTNTRIVTNDPQGTKTGVTYSGILGLVQTGRAGGAWNGPGINTDQADALANKTSIGVATAAEAKGLVGAATTLWSGQTIDANDTLIMYTYAGDANLDGAITADDYASIDLYFLAGGQGTWYRGDFNYDGAITADDYALIDANFIANNPPLWVKDGARGIDGGTVALSAVPEPASMSVLALGAMGLMARRRRAK